MNSRQASKHAHRPVDWYLSTEERQVDGPTNSVLNILTEFLIELLGIPWLNLAPIKELVLCHKIIQLRWALFLPQCGDLFLGCESNDENKKPYPTGSVAARVNKDRTLRRTPGQKCQVCYWCIIEDSLKRQHHHRRMEHKDTKSCRETPGTNTRNGQVQMEHPWTL